jgi:hypothetical protein
MDARHRGLALWRRDGGIHVTVLNAGGNWDPASTVLDEGPGCGLPELTFNPAGKALGAWIRREGSFSDVVVRAFKQGSEGENQRAARVPGPADQLQLVLDRRGDAMLAWVAQIGGSFHVQVLGCDGRTGAWDGAPKDLSGPLPSAPQLRLALGARGEALAVWTQYGQPYEGLVACHYFAKERMWGDRPQGVLTGAIRALDLALDEQGNGVVVLVRMEDGRQVMDALTYHAGQATWHHPVRLAGSQEILAPQVRMADGGAAMVVWRQAERAGTSRLFAKTMRGGRWEDRPQSLDADLGPVRAHALAMTSGGRAAVVFAQAHGTTESAYLRTFQHGTWNPVPTQLNAPSAHAHHSVAVDRTQEASVCLWMLGNAASSGLMGSFGK